MNKTFNFELWYIFADARRILKGIKDPDDIHNKLDIYSLVLSSFFSITISIITILLLLFMICSKQTLRMVRILSLLIIDN